jgi:hypothetical protein
MALFGTKKCAAAHRLSSSEFLTLRVPRWLSAAGTAYTAAADWTARDYGKLVQINAVLIQRRNSCRDPAAVP